MEEQEHFGEEFRADMLTKEKEYLVDILTESLVLNLYGRKLLNAIGKAMRSEQWGDTHKDVSDHFIDIMAYFNGKFYDKE